MYVRCTTPFSCELLLAIQGARDSFPGFALHKRHLAGA
jgi:hypothetical protein